MIPATAMTADAIRQSFLDFFRTNGHTIVPSASLLPQSPGLLFTNAVGYPDVPVLAAYLLFVGFLFVMINMVVDILYTFIDPRLRTR